jgi:hypothetical protein
MGADQKARERQDAQVSRANVERLGWNERRMADWRRFVEQQRQSDELAGGLQ